MQTLPQVKDRADAVLTRCIEECYASAKACAACADACLDEGAVRQLRQCIRLSLFCANVCTATAQAASGGRHSSVELVVRMLDACAAACRLCGEECERYAGRYEHCRQCAAVCRRCEQACREAQAGIQ